MTAMVMPVKYMMYGQWFLNGDKVSYNFSIIIQTEGGNHGGREIFPYICMNERARGEALATCTYIKIVFVLCGAKVRLIEHMAANTFRQFYNKNSLSFV